MNETEQEVAEEEADDDVMDPVMHSRRMPPTLEVPVHKGDTRQRAVQRFLDIQYCYGD